jgi:ferredoxin
MAIATDQARVGACRSLSRVVTCLVILREISKEAARKTDMENRLKRSEKPSNDEALTATVQVLDAIDSTKQSRSSMVRDVHLTSLHRSPLCSCSEV